SIERIQSTSGQLKRLTYSALGSSGAVCTVRGLGKVFIQEGDMSTQSYFIVGVIVVVCAGIIYLFVKDKPDSASDGDPMPIGTRRLLAAYLLLVGLVLLLSLWQIGTVDFSIAAVNVESKPITDPSASCSTATAP